MSISVSIALSLPDGRVSPHTMVNAVYCQLFYYSCCWLQSTIYNQQSTSKLSSLRFASLCYCHAVFRSTLEEKRSPPNESAAASKCSRNFVFTTPTVLRLHSRTDRRIVSKMSSACLKIDSSYLYFRTRSYLSRFRQLVSVTNELGGSSFDVYSTSLHTAPAGRLVVL